MKDFNGDPVALELVKAKNTIASMKAALQIIGRPGCAKLRPCHHLGVVPGTVCDACAEFGCGRSTAPSDICGPCLAAVTLSLDAS